MEIDRAPQGTPLVVCRTVTRGECPWLNADVGEGTIVYLYRGPTYGCISQNGEAVCFTDKLELPAVELPRSALSSTGKET